MSAKEDITERSRPRDARQDAFAAALAAGNTIEAAGRSVGLSAATSYRWAADPAVASMVNGYRLEVRQRVVSALSTGCTLAVATLIEVARDGKSEHARVNASLGLLSAARDWIELEDIAHQVRDLEERIGGGGGEPGASPRERAKLELLVTKESWGDD